MNRRLMSLQGLCSRNPDFAHPVLMIIRNCSLVRGSYSWCRIRAIISNRAPLTSNVPASEQCSPAGIPGDHEQSAGFSQIQDSIRQDGCRRGSYQELPACLVQTIGGDGDTTKRSRQPQARAHVGGRRLISKDGPMGEWASAGLQLGQFASDQLVTALCS
jgi:hypothetical protein